MMLNIKKNILLNHYFTSRKFCPFENVFKIYKSKITNVIIKYNIMFSKKRIMIIKIMRIIVIMDKMKAIKI